MAESKKKRSSTVRTRVVAADNADTPVKSAKKTASNPTVAKKTTTNARQKASTKQQVAASKKARGTEKVGYFKGAWQELKQVRWPDRKSTWEMTFAVILFTAFFVLFVLLLDAGFKYLFDLVIS